jgi:integrase/recombinase XerD
VRTLTRRAAGSRFELLYGCGIRVSEVIALQPHDLDLKTAMLRADANGPKQRLVPVPDSALAAIRAYLEHGRPLLLRPRKQPCLFLMGNTRAQLLHHLLVFHRSAYGRRPPQLNG